MSTHQKAKRETKAPRASAAWTRLFRTLFLVLLCLVPLALMLVTLKINHASLADYQLLYSDEMDYYMECAAVARNGLFSPATGFFGYNADLHADWLNFGAHAPFSLLPGALLARVSFIQPSMLLMANLLGLALSLILFFVFSKSLKQTSIVLLGLLLFVPFLLYAFTGMVETMIYALSLPLLALLPRLFEENGDCRLRKLYLALVILASLFRITHVFFLAPLLLLELQEGKTKVGWILLKYALVVGALTVFLSLLSAKYPWSFIAQWARSGNKIIFFIRHALGNTRDFLLPSQGEPLEVGFRYSYLLFMSYLALLCLRLYRREGRKASPLLLAQLLIMLAHLFFVLVMYDFDEYKGLRMLAPVLFVMGLLQLLHPRDLPRLSRGLALALMLSLIVIFAPSAKNFYHGAIVGRLQSEPKSELLGKVPYSENPVDRWQNTVYLDTFDMTKLDYSLAQAGLGLMYFRGDEMDDILAEVTLSGLRARYLISSSEMLVPGYDLIEMDGNIALYEKQQP